MMKGIYAISLLVVSNIFMTFAWCGHLKLQETKVISNLAVVWRHNVFLADNSCRV